MGQRRRGASYLLCFQRVYRPGRFRCNPRFWNFETDLARAAFTNRFNDLAGLKCRYRLSVRVRWRRLVSFARRFEGKTGRHRERPQTKTKCEEAGRGGHAESWRAQARRADRGGAQSIQRTASLSPPPSRPRSCRLELLARRTDGHEPRPAPGCTNAGRRVRGVRGCSRFLRDAA